MLRNSDTLYVRASRRVVQWTFRGTLAIGLAGVPFALVLPVHAQQAGARSDLAIESDVLHQLASTAALSGKHIAASTEDGITTLTGNVPDEATRALAQTTAGSVSGVRSVQNKITVNGAAAAESQAPPASASTAAQDAQAVEDAVEMPGAPEDSAQASAPAEAQAQGAPLPKPDPRRQPESEPPPAATAQAGVPPPAGEAQGAPPAAGEPQPGGQGQWGPAGPPPDAQDGRIPGRDEDSRPTNTPGQQAQPYPSGVQAAPSARPPYGGPPQSRARESYPNSAQVPYPRSAGVVRLPQGTLLSVRISEPLDSRRLQEGDTFQAVAAQDVFQSGVLALPRGAELAGRVVGVKKAGAFRGSAGFALQLTEIDLGGRAFPIATDTFATDTQGKGGYTAANTVGGAAMGAIIGALAGGGEGAAVGAVAGGALGTGISAATPSPREVMPPETLLRLHLAAPASVSPVSYQEAQRLAAASNGQPPSLRPRRYGYPRPYGYPPPPPGYPVR